MREKASLAKAYAQITRKLMLWVQSRNRIVAGPRAKAYALRDRGVVLCAINVHFVRISVHLRSA